MNEYDVAVIGGGPAGMAASLGALNEGARKILMIERDSGLGGILNQCIHHGFGLETFRQELTGPQYAQNYKNSIKKTGIDVLLNAMVFDIQKDRTLCCISRENGIQHIKAKAVVFANGCRERTREALTIPGDRCAGIFTAGTAQYLLNIKSFLPGREIVIMGSGDIGLIMARRLTLEGAHVIGVFEIMDRPGGLNRNIVQCLHDYDIPLHLNHTVTRIYGRKRVEAVEVCRVDKNRKPIEETAQIIKCDTLLLSVGLIPECELLKRAGVRMDPVTKGPVISDLMETSEEGLFACGNVAYVHDLVDIVTKESNEAGRNAAKFAMNRLLKEKSIQTEKDEGITMLVPRILTKNNSALRYRIKENVIRGSLEVLDENRELLYQRPVVNYSASEMHSVDIDLKDIHSNMIKVRMVRYE